MDAICIRDLKRDLKKNMDESRYEHTLGVMADIAELYQQLNLDEAEYIYMLLDGEKAADVLLELDEDDREKMLKQLPSEVIAKQFIDYMDSDDAVDLIREMDE